MGRENQTSEHLLKLAALNEFQSALKYKKSYEELAHGLLGLMNELLRYCKKNGLEIPDTETYQRIVSHAQSFILGKFLPDGSYHPYNADEELREPGSTPT